MKTWNCLGVICFGILLLSIASCDDAKDDGHRGFMSKATIINFYGSVYHCYLDNGGLVLSRDKELKGIERGYFSITYNEKDWSTSKDGIRYIYNAHVRASVVYDVIDPLNIDDPKVAQIINSDKNRVPTIFALESGYEGYFDLNLANRSVNMKTGEEIPAIINLIYDPTKQKTDTLLLQLYYNPNIPADWENTSNNYGDVSCDISSLINLKEWADSVVVVVEAGDKKKHTSKISKNNFSKPTIKIE